MRVVIINKSDATGGAAVVSMRLLEALRDAGVDARMLVAEKLRESPYIELAASPLRIKEAFLAERLKIYAKLGFRKENLFKIDTASDGLPLASHPWVREADIVCLAWVNQGMLSLKEIERIHAMGKPIVWVMHDMWCLTGICHHAGTCRGYLASCGDCPLMGRKASAGDLSAQIHARKAKVYGQVPISFVTVSNWLAQKARESSLLRDVSVNVIPNPFDLSAEAPTRNTQSDVTTLIMGAARLDDPIKGLPILVRATRLLATDRDRRYRLLTYGRVKDQTALQGIAIDHEELGYLATDEQVRNAYARADIVVSASLYETLPGTLVEGQAWGCIPVSFDRGGQRDITDHLRTGYIAEYDDDIGRSAANLAEGIRWAAANGSETMRDEMRRSVTERFSSQIVAQEYINLFKKLL